MELISAGAQLFRVLRADPTLNDEILKIRAVLPTSWGLIERSECWRKNKTIDHLLPQLKDVTYEAQSILNEFNYQESKQRVEAQNSNFAGELLYKPLHNFRNWMGGVSSKAKEVRERLDYIYKKLKDTCDQHGIPANPNKFSETARPMTSSFVTEPKVFGREKELEMLISLLRVPSGRNQGSSSIKRAKKVKGSELDVSSSIPRIGNVSVLPIVGIGGVGKTTLAQKVCNTEIVKSHFELIIWICVSDNFDVARLSKEIIERATKKLCDIGNLDTLQVVLKETLESKRILLVLDDVWSESRKDWECLFRPIEQVSEGSMIIVTTRSLEVARITRTIKMQSIILEGLEEGVYWELFKSCAFREANSQNYPRLEEIGRKIVVRLKGSPLAAKTLGSLLSTDLDERHWGTIRDSEIWELDQKEDGILPVLQLSYQYLPPHLKRCFSFCSLYPKDYEFSEEELKMLWVNQGLIAPQLRQNMKVVAKGYILELVSMCFFQKVSGFRSLYFIHDLIHDVSQSITKDECFLLENKKFEQKISIDVRHLSIFESELNLDKSKELCRYNKLHSLMIHGKGIYGFEAIDSWFRELRNICSLSLAYCLISKLPECIGNLRHLQILDISYTNIGQLPNSFCNLYNLEFLDMRDCKHFQCFPDGSDRLIRMKMLLLNSSKLKLVSHIPNLAKAILFEYGMGIRLDKTTGDTIGMLKNITGIHGEMTIRRLDQVSDKKEAEEAALNNKVFIDSLNLRWDEYARIHSICNDASCEEVLEGLCPHPNLKELIISYYGGENLNPSWFGRETLTDLTRVRIYHCRNITRPRLPPSITELELNYCPRLTSLQDCLMPCNLPALQKIEISFCDELVSVPVETFNEFTSLTSLKVRSCPKLICPREMVLSPSVQTIQLESCGELENSFPSCFRNNTSPNDLTIGNFRNLSCPRRMALPPSLQNLRVKECDKVEESFTSSLLNLTSLRCLRISGCPNLTCPKEMTLPSSLEALHLKSCGELEELLSDCLHNLTSLTTLTIHNCNRIRSIPVEATSALKSLKYLEVSNCSKLESIGDHQFLASVKHVNIRECPKLRHDKGKNKRKG